LCGQATVGSSWRQGPKEQLSEGRSTRYKRNKLLCRVRHFLVAGGGGCARRAVRKTVDYNIGEVCERGGEVIFMFGLKSVWVAGNQLYRSEACKTDRLRDTAKAARHTTSLTAQAPVREPAEHLLAHIYEAERGSGNATGPHSCHSLLPNLRGMQHGGYFRDLHSRICGAGSSCLDPASERSNTYHRVRSQRSRRHFATLSQAWHMAWKREGG